jgi:transposase
VEYRKLSRKEKIKAVEDVNNGMRISEVAKILGIPKTTISNWLAKEEFNPDKEYVRIRAERKGSKKHAQKDPFPEGVEMARNKDPQELERENRDLRRKNAYLEDKVAYLEALYEIIKESPDTISKKNDAGQSQRSSEKDTPT